MEIRHTRGMQFVASRRGHQITIDQPVTGGGLDRGMTPPELFIASLGSCIGVYVVDFCDRHEISTEGMTISLSWEKAADPPSRISDIRANVVLPMEVPENMRAAIHRVAEQCLIHNTITHPPSIAIEIHADTRK